MSLKQLAARLYRFSSKFLASQDAAPFFKNVLIHPDLSLVYVKVPKSGCSTIIARLLPEAEQNNGQSTLHLHSKNELVGFEDRNFLPYLGKLRDKKFLLFTTVRNPFTRLLSAYREKIELMLDAPRFREEFGYSKGDEVTFAAFVDRLITRDPRFIDMHFQPQSLIVRPDFVKYDKIFHLEDMQACLDWVDAQTKRKSPIENSAIAPHATGATSRLAEYYDADTVQKVARYYADDFVYFGYSNALEEATIIQDAVNSGQKVLAEVSPGKFLSADSWLRARLPGLLTRHAKT